MPLNVNVNLNDYGVAVAQGLSQHRVIGRSLVQFPCSAWTEPQTAPDVLVGTLHGSHRHQCMNGTKASVKCPKCEYMRITSHGAFGAWKA